MSNPFYIKGNNQERSNTLLFYYRVLENIRNFLLAGISDRSEVTAIFLICKKLFCLPEESEILQFYNLAYNTNHSVKGALMQLLSWNIFGSKSLHVL
jgi:hypothetical protein